jgi:hypothetical protein
LYDFKGAKLGMGLEEWKAMQPPHLKELKGGQFTDSSDLPTVHCSTLAGAYASPEEVALGVVRCYYEMPSAGYQFIPIGDAIADGVTYSFLDNKLFRIEVSAKNYAMSEVLSGLKAKFGEPTSSIDDTTQNKAGATFPHHTRVWTNPASSILVESPFTRIDNMIVIYETEEARQKIKSYKAVASPDAAKM